MRHIAKKAALYFVMAALFWVGYQTIAALTIERSRNLSLLTWLDEQIPLIPAFVLPYMSLYVLFWLPPICSRRISYDDFRVMIKATAIAFLVSFVMYLAMPSAYPRPHIVSGNSIILAILADFLYRYDFPNNTFPSTHAAVVAILLLATKGKLLRSTYVIYALWGISILASTLTLKQHYVTDIVLGTLVGALALYVAKRLNNRSKNKASS